MNMYENLEGKQKLLIEAELEPIQGSRFQPTGFPNIGAAEYTGSDGTTMLLVESEQSMANRMEEVCWDDEKDRLVEPLKGLSYIHVDLDEDGAYTNSILEAHRINSEYITGKKGDFDDKLEEEIGYDEKKPVPFKKFYEKLFEYDVNSLVHGAFLEEIAGRLKVKRMLSAFIEARDVNAVHSGGVKFSRVEPGAGEGEGNVPFSRVEYTADEIKAYFNIDLAGIRSLSLGDEAEDLLVTLSLYKIRKFIEEGLRLRTACDLEVLDNLTVTRPVSFSIPDIQTLETDMQKLIDECQDMFADPPKTVLEVES